MKKEIAPVLCATLLNLLLSSCTGGAARQTNQSLSIYYNKNQLPLTFGSVISEYKGEYPNVDFKVYDPTGGDSTMTGANAIKKMDSDIMVGKGPNLIIATTSDMDVYKMAKAGAFFDVNQFVSKDSMFNINDYNNTVMNAGIINGKRYIIPLTYQIPVLLTAKQKMGENGLRLDRVTDADQFNSEALRVLERNSSATLYNRIEFGDNSSGYGKLLSYQFPEAFDLKKEQVNFDTPQFKKAIELCKVEYTREQAYPELVIQQDPSPEYSEYLERFAQNNILFDQNTKISWILGEAAFFQTFGQAETIPLYNDAGGLTAQVTYFAAITSNSPNRRNAYEFLKILLSPTLMGTVDIPVLNSEVKSLILDTQNALNKEIDSSKAEADGGYPESKLPEGFYQTCASYPAKVNRVILNMTPYDELLEQFQPYFEGKETYEKCLKDAKNYFDLYMSE